MLTLLILLLTLAALAALWRALTRPSPETRLMQVRARLRATNLLRQSYEGRTRTPEEEATYNDLCMRYAHLVVEETDIARSLEERSTPR